MGLYGKRWWRFRASSKRFFQSGGPSADRCSCKSLRLLILWASLREAIPFSMYTFIRLMWLSAYQVRKRETTWILQMHFSLYHIILLGSSGQILQYILILPNPPWKKGHVQEGSHYQTAFGCFWAMVAEVLIRYRLSCTTLEDRCYQANESTARINLQTFNALEPNQPFQVSWDGYWKCWISSSNTQESQLDSDSVPPKDTRLPKPYVLQSSLKTTSKWMKLENLNLSWNPCAPI